MMLLVPYIPFMAALREHQINGIASLAAMLMVARSPASAVSSLNSLQLVLCPLHAIDGLWSSKLPAVTIEGILDMLIMLSSLLCGLKE